MTTTDFHIPNRLILGLLITFLLLIQIKLNQNLSMIGLAWMEPPTTEGKKLDPVLLRILSFGNLPMTIDYLTISLLGDPSIDRVPKGTHPTSYYYLDAIGELDPMFSEINILANMLAVLRGDSLGARELLERSQSFVRDHLSEYSEAFKTKYWPYPWQGLLFLAYVNTFELDNLPRAAKAFREAATMLGAPKYLQRLEKKLNRPGGEYEVGLKLLEFLISGAKDEKYRATLEKRFLDLSISYFLFKINQAFREFTIARPNSPSTLLWANFLKSTHTSITDPWGGQLQLNNNGKIISTTPHEKVYGLE